MSIGEQNRGELKKLLPPWDPEEFEQLCNAACFTLRDMALWCGCDKATMRTWAVLKTTPHRVKQHYLRPRLDLLKRALKEMPDRLPVPMLKRKDRVQYVQEVLTDALKLPKANTAKRRV